LHIGNVGTGYNVVKELRRRGYEADLFVGKNQTGGKYTSVNNPLSFDFNSDSIPDWFHEFDGKPWRSKFKIIKLMKKYDIIHSYMHLPIYAMLSNKPYVAHSVGDDLRVLAFQKSIIGILLKRAYNKAGKFIYEWVPHKPFVDKLGLKNATFIPKPWNASLFYNKRKKSINNKLTIFHPLGQDWNWKGNDKFLKAFVRLCKETDNIILHYVNWGKDSKKAKKILDEYDLKDKINIMQGPISRKEMIEYMSKSDILADQFNSGSFTRTGIEALTYGIPILMNLDESLHLELFGDIPSIINCKNEEEIYQSLKNLSNDRESLSLIGIKSQEWVLKHYNIEKIVDSYIDIYNLILQK
jgi:glycosyltransferase involved in cell wall biosynthesis